MKKIFHMITMTFLLTPFSVFAQSNCLVKLEYMANNMIKADVAAELKHHAVKYIESASGVLLTDENPDFLMRIRSSVNHDSRDFDLLKSEAMVVVYKGPEIDLDNVIYIEAGMGQSKKSSQEAASGPEQKIALGKAFKKFFQTCDEMRAVY